LYQGLLRRRRAGEELPYEALPDDLRDAVKVALFELVPRAVFLQKTGRPSRAFEAAAVYLKAIPEAFQYYGLQGVQEQLLYIDANLTHWRTPIGRQCRKVFQKHERTIHELLRK
jgi:hypothetical protein